MKLAELLAEFEGLDPEDKLELLHEFSDGLPEPSGTRATQPPPPECRVRECQSAVDLWVDLRGGRVHLEAIVPRQSPTVRGLVALLVEGLEGASPAEVAGMSDDLLGELGLSETLGMARQRGTRGLIAKIKRDLSVAGDMPSAEGDS